MITRNYFFKAKRVRECSDGSYAYWESTISNKSWFDRGLHVYAQATSRAEELLLTEDGDSLEILAFNRI